MTTANLQRELDVARSQVARTEIMLRERAVAHAATSARADTLAEQLTVVVDVLRIALDYMPAVEDRRHAAGVIHIIDATTRGQR